MHAGLFFMYRICAVPEIAQQAQSPDCYPILAKAFFTKLGKANAALWVSTL